jgi:hypothetical protein
MILATDMSAHNEIVSRIGHHAVKAQSNELYAVKQSESFNLVGFAF